MNPESATADSQPDMRKRSIDFFRGLKVVLSLGGVLIVWAVLWFVGGKEPALIALGVLPLFVPMVGALVFDVVEHFWCKFKKVGGPGAWSDPEMMVLGVLIPAMGCGVMSTFWACIGLSIDASTALTQISLLLIMFMASRLTLAQTMSSGRQTNNFTRGGLHILDGIGITTAAFYALIDLLMIYLYFKNGSGNFLELFTNPLSLLVIVTLLGPVTAVVILLKLNYRLMNTTGSNLRNANICTACGAALGVFLIFGPTLPHTFNRRVAYEIVMGNSYSALYGSSDDSHIDAERFRREGVQKLRSWAIPQLLLEDCYGPTAEVGEYLLAALTQQTPKTVSTTDMAEVYYRVYGKSVAEMPVPWRFVPSVWMQDMMRGRQSVGTKVPGLHLADSNIEGVASADAGLGYLEWTMTFSNTSTGQKEARLQLELPPQAVVSRAVLWVRGQPRDAAFTERGVATRAYQSVVMERKDPLLVTSAGPGRVLVQCFPVPEHGRMKVMIGISMPLTDAGGNSRRLAFPAIVETNCADCCAHTIAVRSDGSPLTKLRLPDEALSKAGVGVQLTTSGKNADFYEPDFVNKDKIFLEKTHGATKNKIAHTTIVLDCSASVAPYKREIAEAIAGCGGDMPVDLILASDQTTPCSDGLAIVCDKKAAEAVQQLVFAGGPPNFDALEKAWESESKNQNGAIIWIHGTQPNYPRTFSRGSSMFNFLDSEYYDERPRAWLSRDSTSTSQTVFIDVEVEHGINRIAESLDPASCQRAPELVLLPRSASLTEDIQNCIKSLSNGSYGEVLPIERTDVRSQTGTHLKQQGLDTCLAKLWAQAKTLELLKQSDAREAIELSSKYQVITPVSAAVALEFRTQYKDAGIAPPAPISATPRLRADDGITSQLNSLNRESPKSPVAKGGGGDAFDAGSSRQAEGAPSGDSAGHTTEAPPRATAAPSFFGNSGDANLFSESSRPSEKSRSDNQQFLYLLVGFGVIGAVIVAVFVVKRRKPEAKKESE